MCRCGLCGGRGLDSSSGLCATDKSFSQEVVRKKIASFPVMTLENLSINVKKHYSLRVFFCVCPEITPYP